MESFNSSPDFYVASAHLAGSVTNGVPLGIQPTGEPRFRLSPTKAGSPPRSTETDVQGKTLRYDPSTSTESTSDAQHVDGAIESIESVELNHTAPITRLRLNTDYSIQALATGSPLLLADMLATTGSLIVVGSIVNASQGHVFNGGLWLQLPVWIMLQMTVMWMHQLYPGAGVAAVSEMRGIARSACLACIGLCGINLVFGQLPRIEFGIFVITALVVSLVLPAVRRVMRTVLAKTSWWGMRTLLVGSPAACKRWCELMQSSRESGLRVIGYVASPTSSHLGAQQAEWSEDTNHLGTDFEAHRVACDHHAPVATLTSDEAAHLAHRLMFQFPSLMWLDPSAAMMETANPIGAFNRRLNVPFLRLTPRLMKRAMDIAICLPLLMILALPLGILAIAIKVLSPGAIFYGSPRVGQYGRRFKMWKFRSMVLDAEEVLKQHLSENPEARAEWGFDQKLKEDPRVIRGIGRIMRSCSIDELPQLWNVLVGEMSLVGPRPLPPGEIVKYQTHYYQYSHMWPGITGLWQVSGRNDTSFEMRVFLVHHYAANWSLWLDVWILLKTPLTVITRKGAY